ncbi:MAG: glycosyltransferase family 2 protein [Deltaproteobacteria bacterium]|nr:glycosyltransferase family 2 protein [Deltaproteobacteria bacterium]
MVDPKVSCIVPVHNGERYLRQALDSVLAQTFPVHEVIVVDDGSTDTSVAIARVFGSPVRVVSQSWQGPADARNHGLRLAVGELIAFNDADDIWATDKLARQVERFSQLPEIAICAVHVQQFHDDPGRPDERRPVGPTLPCYGPPSLLIERAAFDRIGVFNPALRVSEDTDWMVRARDAGLPTDLLGQPLLYRRLHASNLSRNNLSVRNDALARIFKTHLDRVRRDIPS